MKGRCAIGLHGGEPSFGTCEICLTQDLPKDVPKRAGDWFSWAFQKLGFKKRNCGCSKRQAWITRTWTKLVRKIKGKKVSLPQVKPQLEKIERINPGLSGKPFIEEGL